MGYKRKQRWKSSKRKRRRRGKRVFALTKSPVPKQKAIQLRYAQCVSINGPLGATPTYHTFRANDCYDPDYSGVGHQPYGFDQWALFYDHFVVVSSKIKVTFCYNDSPATSVNAPITCFIAKDDNVNLLAGNLSHLMELGKARCARGILNQSYNNQVVLSKTLSVRKFLGRSHPLSDPELKGSIGAPCSELAYFHVGYCPCASIDPISVTCYVEITYNVVFIEPNEINQS